MSDDFRDDKEKKDEVEKNKENNEKEVTLEGISKTTDLSNEQNVYI